MKEWMNYHVNATAWLVYILSYVLIAVLAWNIPFPPNIAYLLVLLGIGGWLLRKKSRSLNNLWWAVLFFMSYSYQCSQGYTMMTTDLASYAGEVIGAFSLSMIIWTLLHNKSIIATATTATGSEEGTAKSDVTPVPKESIRRSISPTFWIVLAVVIIGLLIIIGWVKW